MTMDGDHFQKCLLLLSLKIQSIPQYLNELAPSCPTADFSGELTQKHDSYFLSVFAFQRHQQSCQGMVGLLSLTVSLALVFYDFKKELLIKELLEHSDHPRFLQLTLSLEHPIWPVVSW